MTTAAIHLSSKHWIKIILHRQVWICPKPSLGKTLSSLKIAELPTSSRRSGSWWLILVSTKSIQILSFRPCLAGKLQVVYENALEGLSSSPSMQQCRSILWSDVMWPASTFGDLGRRKMKKACKGCTREGRDFDRHRDSKGVTVDSKRFKESSLQVTQGQLCKMLRILQNIWQCSTGGLCVLSKGLGFHVTTSIPFRMPLRKNLTVGESKGTCCTDTNWATLGYGLAILEGKRIVGRLKFATCKFDEFSRFCNTM